MILNFNRKPDESEEELIYRVCSQKESNPSWTWNDVAETLNELLGNDYTESKYRKQYSAFQKMLKANKDIFVDEDSYSKELDKKYEDIKKERIKLQTLNVERNRINRQDNRRELFYEYIGSVVESLPLPKFQPLFLKEDNDKEYILCISDIHDGATFKSINNEYSFDIVEQRFELLLGKTIQFVKEKGLQEIKVLNTGDTIQGLIHTNDLRINDSTVVKSVVHASRMIAMFLNELSAYCQVGYYHSPTANHTQLRVLGAKSNELMDEDLEYVIGHYIADLCIMNDRIKVHLQEENAKPYIQINMYNGLNVIALHGHTIKNIEDSIKDLSIITRKFIDCLILGHFHSGREISIYDCGTNDCEVLINPSFIGSDPYSESIFKGNKSAVKIYGFDIDGHTETYKFILN